MPDSQVAAQKTAAVFFQTMIFRIRVRLPNVASFFRAAWWRLLGMHIGAGTTVGRLEVTWPHQFQVGKNCALLSGLTIDYCHGVWQPGPSILLGDRCYVGRCVEFNVLLGVRLGNDCLIGSGCRFIDHDHGTAINAGPMKTQSGPEAAIVVEDDVWLGANVIVLKGVTIGRGAVVAASAVVTRSIPSMEIWAGIPAKRIGMRGEISS